MIKSHPLHSLIFILAAYVPLKASFNHPLQNFDDDVDRLKTYSNSFGGNYGIVDGDPNTSQIKSFSKDTATTRSGHGRSLRINYGPLNNWSMWVESFNGKWTDSAKTPKPFLNLNDLFPGFNSTYFQSRHIDSIVFFAKLKSINPLTLKLELHDTLGRASNRTVVLDTVAKWQRVSVALNSLVGSIDLSIAKFLGIVIADYPDNSNESGTLWLDDFYLVEKDFSKPAFSSDDSLLSYLNQVNFRHFWMAVEPLSGLSLDRHIWNDLISIDAVGFQLTAYSIAMQNRWVDSTLIRLRLEKILFTLLHVCKHASDTSEVLANPLGFASVDGNWAHFLDNKTLQRKGDSTEFSIFTNALLNAGLIVVREQFHGSAAGSMADTLLRMNNWRFFQDKNPGKVHYSWKPHQGMSTAYADWWTEELDLAFLLSQASLEPSHRLQNDPFNSLEYRKPKSSGLQPFVYSAPGSNFTYYFLQMYVKFKDTDSAFHRAGNVRNALLKDWEFSKSNFGSMGYDSRVFGITACEGPDSAGEPGISNYHAYGFDPRNDEVNQPNGTFAVYGSASAVLFIPRQGISTLKYYYTELDSLLQADYGYGFWSPIFGFPDAFHLHPDSSDDIAVNSLGFRGPWLSVPRFGIDVGPMLMNIDSYLKEKNGRESIRMLFTKAGEISPLVSHYDPIIEDASTGNRKAISDYKSKPKRIFDSLGRNGKTKKRGVLLLSR